MKKLLIGGMFFLIILVSFASAINKNIIVNTNFSSYPDEDGNVYICSAAGDGPRNASFIFTPNETATAEIIEFRVEDVIGANSNVYVDIYSLNTNNLPNVRLCEMGSVSAASIPAHTATAAVLNSSGGSCSLTAYTPYALVFWDDGGDCLNNYNRIITDSSKNNATTWNNNQGGGWVIESNEYGIFRVYGTVESGGGEESDFESIDVNITYPTQNLTALNYDNLSEGYLNITAKYNYSGATCGINDSRFSLLKNTSTISVFRNISVIQDSNLSIVVFCNHSGSGITLNGSTGINFKLDTNSPIIMASFELSNNLTFLRPTENLITTINITDNIRLWSINITLQNGTSLLDPIELEGTMYSANISNYTQWNSWIDVEACDAHTKQIDTFTNINDDFGLKYMFKTNSEQLIDDYIYILPKNPLEYKKAETKFIEDRYTFKFHKNENTLGIETFIVESSNKLHIVKNSEYGGHLITGKYWIDFENENETYTYKFNKINDFVVEVTVIGLTGKNFNFHSIGGLNCITERFYFFEAPPQNVSLNVIYYEIDEIIVNTDTYVEITNITFNLSQTSCMNFQGGAEGRKTQASTGDLYMRGRFNDNIIFDSKVRSFNGVHDRGVFNIPLNSSRGQSGTNELIIEAREEGLGGINISNFKLLITTNLTNSSREVGTIDFNANVNFESTTFVNIYNFTNNKSSENASYYINIIHTFSKPSAGADTPTCYLENNETLERTPKYTRYLSGATDVGSSGVNFISRATNKAVDQWQLFCNSFNGDVISNNITLLLIELSDKDFHDTINANQNSSELTGVTGNNNIITSQSHTHRSGNAIAVLATVILQSTSAQQDGEDSPLIKLNSSNIKEDLCEGTYIRSLSGNDDIGTAKIYLVCNETVIGTDYEFNIYLTTYGGGTIDILNTSLSIFDVTLINVSKGIVAPNVIIIDPLNNSNVSSLININISITDINELGWKSNISLFNMDGTWNYTIFDEQEKSNITNKSFLTTFVDDDNYTIRWNVSNDEASSFDIVNIRVNNFAPSWLQIPNNISLEYYYETLEVNYNATDKQHIYYKINDTANFNITLDGELRNKTLLPVGRYYINITANDTEDNMNYTLLLIHINDTTAPKFSQIPKNVSYEVGTGNISIKFNVSDISVIDSIDINDTLNFSINDLGILRNITLVPVGWYYINVSVNDSYDNRNWTVINITYIDETAPQWNKLPDNSTWLVNEEHILVHFNATDFSGLDNYSINDTTNFNISADGIIGNATLLKNISYYINVTVNDTFGHRNYTILNVTIINTTMTSIITTPSGGGGGGGTLPICNIKVEGSDLLFEYGKETNTVKLTNNGTEDLTFTISVPLIPTYYGSKDYILTDKQAITLESGSSEVITYVQSDASGIITSTNLTSEIVSSSCYVPINLQVEPQPEAFYSLRVSTSLLAFAGTTKKFNVIINNKMGEIDRNTQLNTMIIIPDGTSYEYEIKRFDEIPLGETTIAEIYEITEDSPIGIYRINVEYNTPKQGIITTTSFFLLLPKKTETIIWVVIIAIVLLIIIGLFNKFVFRRK